MIKNPPSNVRDAGSVPGWGTKIPHATEQLSQHAPNYQTCALWSPCTTIRESICHNERSNMQLKPNAAKFFFFLIAGFIFLTQDSLVNTTTFLPSWRHIRLSRISNSLYSITQTHLFLVQFYPLQNMVNPFDTFTQSHWIPPSSKPTPYS